MAAGHNTFWLPGDAAPAENGSGMPRQPRAAVPARPRRRGGWPELAALAWADAKQGEGSQDGFASRSRGAVVAGAEKWELARPRDGCEMWAGNGRQGGRGRVALMGRIGRLRSQNGRTDG